jgi:hypothetical protein
MKRSRVVSLSIPVFVAIVGLAALSPVSIAQSATDAKSSFSDAVSPTAGSISPRLELIYTRPTEKTKLRNYFFDGFGPYPIISAGIVGGIDQADKTPPEWGQGVGAFGERVGSDFGISLATTTTRYALAEAFREDTLYYHCECRGIFPRLGHAAISTLTARRGENGHRWLSFAALIAPYAGSMTAVYGWYPNRYSAKDGFRMGNYTLLEFVGMNIAREFIGGSHSLFGRMDHSTGTETDAIAQSKP